MLEKRTKSLVMMISATEETMFYCPKCQETYDDDSQRFCNNDGGRLLPAPTSSKSSANSGGVFTSLIGKVESPGSNDEKLAALPRFEKSEHSTLPVYEVLSSKRQIQNFQDEVEIELELEPPVQKPKPPTAENFIPKPKTETLAAPPLPEILELSSKPAAKIINPGEIPSGTAAIGDRKINPAGRAALSKKNSQTLIGAHIKGRYDILEQLETDETGISYLADDQLVPDKKVVFRILMNDEAENYSAINSEEHISLAHVDHPNIVRLIDSGELLEGRQFIVTEYLEAESVADVLKAGGQLNVLRTARIIRQAAYGLSEAHQNGVLHRNLKPENLLLDVTEAGTEQVKINNFGASAAVNSELTYKSPEILEGKSATFAADIYSLAVIAYQMLSDRLPFQGANAKELLKNQREGLGIYPSSLRLDLPKLIDLVLEKALAYDSSERYPKARDFGDAFFNALTTPATRQETAESGEMVKLFTARPKKEITILPVAGSETGESSGEILELGAIDAKADTPPVIGDIHIKPRAESLEISAEKADELSDAKTSDPAWTRRSSDPPKSNRNLLLFSAIGLAFLLLGLWGIWTYFLNRPAQSEIAPQTIAAAEPQPTIQTSTPNTMPQNSAVSTTDIGEIPPLPRQIEQPPNTVFFQNSKQKAKGDLLRNFLSFTLYYPKDWNINEALAAEKAGTRGKFLDISRNNADGVPLEQMLVSYYESKGTFKADAENFPNLVKETNETLKKIVPNYQMFSEGEIKINGDWKAYEIKFQGGGASANGEKLNLWGRRLFIPMARPGVRSGYEITMFATSLSSDVKNVDDVGVKGELAAILKTFEPNQNF